MCIVVVILIRNADCHMLLSTHLNATCTLSLLLINGESHQKYIRAIIAKIPGELYAHFRLATYEVYV